MEMAMWRQRRESSENNQRSNNNVTLIFHVPRSPRSRIMEDRHCHLCGLNVRKTTYQSFNCRAYSALALCNAQNSGNQSQNALPIYTNAQKADIVASDSDFTDRLSQVAARQAP